MNFRMNDDGLIAQKIVQCAVSDESLLSLEFLFCLLATYLHDLPNRNYYDNRIIENNSM